MGLYEDCGVYLGPDSTDRVQRDRGLCRAFAGLADDDSLTERALAKLQRKAAYHGQRAGRFINWAGHHWQQQEQCAARHDRIVKWARRTGRIDY